MKWVKTTTFPRLWPFLKKKTSASLVHCGFLLLYLLLLHTVISPTCTHLSNYYIHNLKKKICPGILGRATEVKIFTKKPEESF